VSGFDLSALLTATVQPISEDLMPDSFTVDVPGAFIPDGQGGGRHSPPTTRGPYRCRFGQADASEVNVADRDQEDTGERISYPVDVALASHEVGTGTHTKTGAVFRFEVEAVFPLTSYAVNRRARIKRIPNAP
jgi:hypothetical protein